MTAEQTRAAPHDFVWSMRGGRGAMRIPRARTAVAGRGSGATGLIPVARIGGDRDHARSAFGRYICGNGVLDAGGPFPGPAVAWEAVDGGPARVVVTRNGLSQSVDVTVDDAARSARVRFLRWIDANSEKMHRLRPSRGTLSTYRAFGGFTLPTHVEAGNQFGTDDYSEFFITDVRAVRFPMPAGERTRWDRGQRADPHGQHDAVVGG